MVEDLGGVVSQMLADRGVGAPKNAIDFYQIIKSGKRRTRTLMPCRPDTMFSTHDFGRLCAWEEILCARYKLVRMREESPQDRYMFSIGKAYHWMFQNLLFPHGGDTIMTRDCQANRVEAVGDADDLFLGWWKCESCAETHAGKGTGYHSWIPRPKQCRKCGGHEFEFREAAAARDGFISHQDGGIRYNGKVYHVEFKTINGFFFKQLGIVPRDPDHIVQVRLNQHTCGIDRSLLVYINKEEPTGSKSMKTYEVRYAAKDVAPSLRKAESIINGIKNEDSPLPAGCASCADPGDKRAQACIARKWCPVCVGP
jgi:hypothetical protein